MTNPWLSGQIAKSIANKKRTRRFWNVFFITLTCCILAVTALLILQVSADYVKHNEEHVFVEYNDGYLITQSSSFKIAEYDRQDVKISTLAKRVKQGETVTLTVSNLSNKLLEVKYRGETVYNKIPASIGALVALCAGLVAPIIAFCIFMLVVTNIKNPGKRIDKIQSQYLLRFYK